MIRIQSSNLFRVCSAASPWTANSGYPCLDSDLDSRHLLELGIGPWLVCLAYKYCQSSMEACIVASVRSFRHLSRHLTNLCSLVFGVLANLMGLSTSLLKKFRGDPPLMENMVGELPEPEPELVPDVLTSIFALLEVPDLVRAGSACSYWRSVYTGLRSQLGQYNRRQMPCLLYTSESAGENVACLYSLAEKSVYKLTLPDPPIRRRHLIGSSHGWLVTADERSELHLVNPITGEQIALPSVITLEQVKPIFDSESALHKYEHWYPQYDYCSLELLGHEPSICALDELRDYLYFKAYVFPDPFTGSYIVVLIHKPENQISFARAGDCEWTFLPPGWNYQECLYKDGLLYAATSTGGIDGFDLTGPTVTRKMSLRDLKDYICEQIYIVQAPWGDMLQVWREAFRVDGDDPSEIITKTSKKNLHKVDMAAKKLVEIDGLHDHVLFLRRNQSQCLSVEEYPHLKANCVYFTDDEEIIAMYKDSRRDIGVLNLGNDTREDIVPQLYGSWPNPIWITPNLRMMYSGLM